MAKSDGVVVVFPAVWVVSAPGAPSPDPLPSLDGSEVEVEEKTEGTNYPLVMKKKEEWKEKKEKSEVAGT